MEGLDGEEGRVTGLSRSTQTFSTITVESETLQTREDEANLTPYYKKGFVRTVDVGAPR